MQENWRSFEQNSFQNTGKDFEQIVLDTERDNFMTAEEALTYGLIDKVVSSR